jgi:hypothetical protein
MTDGIKRVIYISDHKDYSNQNLKDIIEASQKNNPHKNVTGCLISGNSAYLQILEGPISSVDELYSKIKKDKRHSNIKMLIEEPINSRLFSSWSMRLDPFNNLMWSEESLSKGDFSNLNPTKASNIFTRISEDGTSIF